MRPLDLLGMAAVSLALSWCVFDLAGRASDPYDIHSRQRIAPAGGITGHGERASTARLYNRELPKAQGVADHTTARELSALDSPAFPASFAGSIATRNQDQEVTPAPGRIEPSRLVQAKARESTRALTKAQLAAEVRAALPKLPDAEVDAAVWIIWRESGGRTTAKNPRSSSHGLNGFLRSTWRNVTSRSGIRHGLDPKSQILAMHHYVTRRYGSLLVEAAYKELAKKHHPDKGGTRSDWDDLQRAVAEARSR